MCFGCSSVSLASCGPPVCSEALKLPDISRHGSGMGGFCRAKAVWTDLSGLGIRERFARRASDKSLSRETIGKNWEFHSAKPKARQGRGSGSERVHQQNEPESIPQHSVILSKWLRTSWPAGTPRWRGDLAGDITRHFDGTAVMAGIKMGPSWERWRLLAVCKDFCHLRGMTGRQNTSCP